MNFMNTPENGFEGDVAAPGMESIDFNQDTFPRYAQVMFVEGLKYKSVSESVSDGVKILEDQSNQEKIMYRLKATVNVEVNRLSKENIANAVAGYLVGGNLEFSSAMSKLLAEAYGEDYTNDVEQGKRLKERAISEIARNQEVTQFAEELLENMNSSVA
jgi:hypothetical protein